jgi:SAM-dependent methyltransferase
MRLITRTSGPGPATFAEGSVLTRFDGLRGEVERYYTGKVREHGATPRGVDWYDGESQELRFRELMRLRVGEGPFSINDYGCGYGALVGFLRSCGYEFTYTGFDISAEMLDHARRLFPESDSVRFVGKESDLEPADYTVSSGVFNVRLETDEDTWTSYTIEGIRRLWALSTVACSFNMLARHADADREYPDLYFADPWVVFFACNLGLAPHVTLLKDYGLWEFTLILRREPPA